jgi:hypothetical protein
MQPGVPPSSVEVCARLAARLAETGRSLGRREADHAASLEEAGKRCEALRSLVAAALDAFHEAAAAAGAPQLRVGLSPVRLDEKHVRAMEFELRRGRHAAIVTVKSRGEVTLVGPFRTGKPEGPCRTFPWDAERDTEAALGDFLQRFLEEAATP